MSEWVSEEEICSGWIEEEICSEWIEEGGKEGLSYPYPIQSNPKSPERERERERAFANIGADLETFYVCVYDMVMVCTYLSIYLNIHFLIHPSLHLSISTYVCMPPIVGRRRTIEFATVIILDNLCFFFSVGN